METWQNKFDQISVKLGKRGINKVILNSSLLIVIVIFSFTNQWWGKTLKDSMSSIAHFIKPYRDPVNL